MIYYARLESGNVKIGCTINLAERILSLHYKPSYRKVVCVLGVHDGGFDVEDAVHKKFDHLRIRPHDWGKRPEDFRPESALVEHIVQNCSLSHDVVEVNCHLLKGIANGWPRTRKRRQRPIPGFIEARKDG
jgi:hypothetical protein